jgi:hypothetical protein
MAGWSLVTIMGNILPPRDPNDDNDEDEDSDTAKSRFAAV